MKNVINTPLSPEAEGVLAGEWPDVPKIDYENSEFVSELRTGLNAMYQGISELCEHDCALEQATIAGRDCMWVRPEKPTSTNIVFYIHGGSGLFGNPLSFHGLATALAMETKCRVLIIDYPKLPEHVYPAPQDVTEKIYRDVLTKNPEVSIQIMADSFGSTLALNLVLRCIEQDLQLPSTLALISPFIDHACEGDSYKPSHVNDPIFDDGEWHKECSAVHIGAADINDPYITTLKADFSGFPPTIIQAASRDICLSDAFRLYEKLEMANVPVDFTVWEGLWHDFQINQSIPEARDAVQQVAKYFCQIFKSS